MKRGTQLTRRQLQKILDDAGVLPNDEILISTTMAGGRGTEVYETTDAIKDYGWEDNGRGGFYYYIDFEN